MWQQIFYLFIFFRKFKQLQTAVTKNQYISLVFVVVFLKDIHLVAQDPSDFGQLVFSAYAGVRICSKFFSFDRRINKLFAFQHNADKRNKRKSKKWKRK